MKRVLKYILLVLVISSLIFFCITVIFKKNEAGKLYNPSQLDVINNKQNKVLKEEVIPNWNLDSKTIKSILLFIQNITDPNSIEYIPVEKRIVVFDFDGTLYGEHFPTYFDSSMLMYRFLYDKSYNATDEQKEYAKALEMTYFDNKPWIEQSKTGEQMAAETFQGFTVKDYRAYVRKFMSCPVIGFEGMTYGEGFYVPMISLIQYLSDNEFTIFISSGSECDLVRELTVGTLDKWIPAYRVIGSTFSLSATKQGDILGDEYIYDKDDKVQIQGEDFKFLNFKMNKVISIIDNIGAIPIMVFGNSSGDFSMAQYVIQHGGKAFMILSDDTTRDYGNLEEANLFKELCHSLGFETISIREEFETIYNKNVRKIKIKRMWSNEY